MLHRIGFDVVPYNGRYFDSKKRIEVMRTADVGIVIDVGANEGQFVEEIRRDGWSGRVVSIEPLPDSYRILAAKADHDQLWTTVNFAAGATKATATLNVAGNRVSSSFFAMSERHRSAARASEYVGTVNVPVDTIDSLAAEQHLSGRLYLKIDTQGYEVEVLSGALTTLGQCAAVELELSMAELYEGQPLMPDVARWLLDRGFVPTALWSSFVSHTGELLQMNGIFIRSPR